MCFGVQRSCLTDCVVVHSVTKQHYGKILSAQISHQGALWATLPESATRGYPQANLPKMVTGGHSQSVSSYWPPGDAPRLVSPNQAERACQAELFGGKQI